LIDRQDPGFQRLRQPRPGLDDLDQLGALPDFCESNL
jgi:hypothetical protein